MAILGLIFALVFSPLGLTFSAFGMGQAERRYERGRGLAIMPTFIGIEQQMTAATSPDQAAQRLAAARTQMVEAISATPDPAFVQQVQKLAAGIQQLETAMATGQVPAGTETTMANDGYAVGQSCGLAGWTP